MTKETLYKFKKIYEAKKDAEGLKRVEIALANAEKAAKAKKGE